MTRRTIDDANPEGWVPEEKITVDEALKAYTVSAAYSSFDEVKKGKIASGMLADFVIMDQDLRAIDPIEIKNVNVVQTYVGGQQVYSKDR